MSTFDSPIPQAADMDVLSSMKHAIGDVDVDIVNVLRSSYIFAASAIILIALIKPLQKRFLPYGSRAQTASKAATNSGAADKKASEGVVSTMLTYLSSFQVPHSWFSHFYIISLLSSIFWAVQILVQGRFFLYVVAHQKEVPAASSMTVNQTLVSWLFMTIQGSRRLYECITLGKPSQSRMWFVHWILGLAFYLLMGISVWIEGSRKSAKTRIVLSEKTNHLAALLLHKFVLNDIPYWDAIFAPDIPTESTILSNPVAHSKPSFKTFIAVPIFLLGSGIQHDCHEYLTSLPKYTLPVHPVFQQVVCPHYTCELLIYLSIAIAAAPPGQLLNKTVFAGLIFVAVNLGVTASTTKDWQIQKFGADKVGKRWKMIPFVF